MNVAIVTGTFLLVVGGCMPAFGEESLLYETWRQSSFDPIHLDEFLQTHRAQYTDDYFRCSQEAQRLIGDEVNIRNRRCDFSGDSVQRNSCRQENLFRGVNKHLAELDQAIQHHKPWLDLESGRNAAAALQAAEEFEKSCTPPACDIAKRKKSQLLRDLKPYLQCPPVAERPSDVDPSFKTFKLPEDPGG
ncbi:MAG TPA: hypothetical protein VJ746_09905 [Nitrospira sp.]|nr:hypothetical protein [Nitrospira sp.]